MKTVDCSKTCYNMEHDFIETTKSTGDSPGHTLQSTGDFMGHPMQSNEDLNTTLHSEEVVTENIIDPSIQSDDDIGSTTQSNRDIIHSQSLQSTDEIMDSDIQPTGDIMDPAIQSTGDILNSTIQSPGDIMNSTARSTGDIMTSTIQSTGDMMNSATQLTGEIINSPIQSPGDIINSKLHSEDIVNARTPVIVLNDRRTDIKEENIRQEEVNEEDAILVESSCIPDRLGESLEVYTYVPVSTDNISGRNVMIQPNQIPIPIQIMTSNCIQLPVGCPQWAARLKDCQKIGTSFRGYVENEIELDLLLTFHKQETGSFWGTRQSPSAERSSMRLMWRSPYVRYDGIPFINMGSRAVTMECQFGPRRKSKSWKRGTSKNFRTSCPARIYIKKVKKFPQYKASNVNDKKGHDTIFHSIKDIGVDKVQGVERWYVQLPTIEAHDYHEPNTTESVMQPMLEAQRQETPPEERMNPKVAKKIQDLMSEGISNDFRIRAKLRQYVLTELFKAEKKPDRHDPRFFPTINNIQNYKHEINKAVENGELILAHNVGDTQTIPAWIEPSVEGSEDGQSREGLSDMAGNELLSQINTTKNTKIGIMPCTDVPDMGETNSQSSNLLPMIDSENTQSNSLLQDSGTESLLREMQNNQSVIESTDHMTDLDQSK